LRSGGWAAPCRSWFLRCGCPSLSYLGTFVEAVAVSSLELELGAVGASSRVRSIEDSCGSLGVSAEGLVFFLGRKKFRMVPLRAFSSAALSVLLGPVLVLVFFAYCTAVPPQVQVQVETDLPQRADAGKTS